ncbi:hypothetical protein PXD56_08430 [Maribacter sp. SA7]|uniref:DUF6134 family protein n=1 Tax=Maribacter zhoushanensis TaxID=3030012 RepID=UPI0023ED9A4F|nr:DUF6134 family protein [Maribacter zhoushanensis]MDF4202977.1 hypothetical protein [Maribacter zhoushanensis]
MSSTHLIITFCSLLFLNLNGDKINSQPYNTLSFNIIHKDKIVGNLHATKTIKSSRVNYQSITTINTRIIKEIEVNYEYDVTYENSLLKTANVLIEVNNKPHANITTSWKESYYQITKNNKKEKVVESDITYATILLYFKEPLDIQKCYSEQDGSFNTIVALGNHIYKKINAKDQENIYHYKDGFLKKAEINGGLVNFEIVAQN